MVLAAVPSALLGVGTPTARAHDELVATVPAADATVPAPPTQVQLELSAPAQALGTRVVVTGPAGAVVSQGAPELRGSTVVQPLPAGLAGGVHTVAWQVTTSDGHPLSGTYSFTVAGSPAVVEDPAPSAATPDPGVASGAATAQPLDPSSGSGWIAAGAAGVVVLAAGVVLLRLRRRA